MKIISIDQGTTSTRGFILNTKGATNLCHAVEHRQFYPKEGWVEHDPKEILNNIWVCLQKADSDIDAIAIDNQGESCLAWDAKSKEPISPIIVWQDKRTASQIETIKKLGYEAQIKSTAGLPLDAYFSASKLAWIFENIPEAKILHQQNRLRMGTTDAYFLDALSGQYVTDITTASRTSLMNIKTGQWDSDLCEIFNVPIDVLPNIVPSTGHFGSVNINGREIAINASIVDQQASLFAHGCRELGDVKMTFGTGAFILATTGKTLHADPSDGLLPTIAWQSVTSPSVDVTTTANTETTYALDGGVYCAASAINWAKSIGLFHEFDEINQFIGTSAIERNLVFIPALVGLACPHWQREASGAWLGLKINTSAQDMMQAILEGIALRASEVLSLMEQYVNLGERMSIDGGLSNNDYFCQFLANINNKQVVVQQNKELTALGGALLVAEYYGEYVKGVNREKQFTPSKDSRHLLSHFGKAVELIKQWQ